MREVEKNQPNYCHSKPPLNMSLQKSTPQKIFLLEVLTMALNGSKTDFILAVKPSILLQKWPKKRLFNSFLLTKTSDTFRLSLLKLPVSFLALINELFQDLTPGIKPKKGCF